MSRYLVVQCCQGDECGVFQVASQTKRRKFRCKVCGLDQSVQRVFLNSESAKDCRLFVQRANQRRGEKIDGTSSGGKPVFLTFASARSSSAASTAEPDWCGVSSGRGSCGAADDPYFEEAPGDIPDPYFGAPRDTARHDPCADCGRYDDRDGDYDDCDGRYYCGACWARYEAPDAPAAGYDTRNDGTDAHRDKRFRPDVPPPPRGFDSGELGPRRD